MPEWTGSIVFFGASDLDAVDAFYGTLLGLQLDRDQGVCRIYGVPGGGALGFCNHIPPVVGSKSPIITLLADDVDSVYTSLKENYDQELSPPIVNNRFGIYHLFVTDPHGYTVEIQKFLDKA